jgi:hypothetical protein
MISRAEKRLLERQTAERYLAIFDELLMIIQVTRSTITIPLKVNLPITNFYRNQKITCFPNWLDK